MASERRLRILGLLGADGSTSGGSRLCAVAAEILDVTGSGIMLMAGDVHRGSLCSTDVVSSLIEELQYALGEGPCVDAYESGRPVMETDLASPATPRWIAFSPAVVEAGVRAVFGFPLRVGAARIGALNLYRDRPGPLTSAQHGDALLMADIAAQAVLMLQAEAVAGSLAEELERSADLQLVVHQASGMVAVQLGATVGQALVRLRAYAFSHERPLADVAIDVVARRLRFQPGTDGEDPDDG